MNPPRARAPAAIADTRNQRGSVLLAVVILLAALTAMSAATLARAAAAAAEQRVRRDALCARYAAIGGLALGTTAGDAAALVAPDVDALTVTLVLAAPGWCVRRAAAACGKATRHLDSAALDPAACTAAPR